MIKEGISLPPGEDKSISEGYEAALLKVQEKVKQCNDDFDLSCRSINLKYFSSKEEEAAIVGHGYPSIRFGVFFRVLRFSIAIEFEGQ
jgi:hypothetical protein